MLLLLFCYIPQAVYTKVTILKLTRTLTLTLTVSLYPNTIPNPNGHRKPYRLYEGGESKTDLNLNSNPNRIPKP